MTDYKTSKTYAIARAGDGGAAIQLALDGIAAELQQVVDHTHPADYWLLLAVLVHCTAALRAALPGEQRELAENLTEITGVKTITLPASLWSLARNGAAPEPGVEKGG